jgi:hypothetical protein
MCRRMFALRLPRGEIMAWAASKHSLYTGYPFTVYGLVVGYAHTSYIDKSIRSLHPCTPETNLSSNDTPHASNAIEAR